MLLIKVNQAAELETCRILDKLKTYTESPVEHMAWLLKKNFLMTAINKQKQ